MDTEDVSLVTKHAKRQLYENWQYLMLLLIVSHDTPYDDE